MNSFFRRSLTVPAVLLLGVAACATHPTTPLSSPVASTVPGGASAVWAGEAGPWPQAAWWSDFADPGLSALVERVIGANPDLKTAAARARLAAHLAEAAGAVRRPNVDATGSLARERLTQTGLAPPPYGGMTLTAGDVSLALGWKLDLWGAERARIAARRYEQSAAEVDALYVRSTVAAAAARLYFELGAALSDRELLVAAETTGAEGVAILRHRVAAGLDGVERLHHAEADQAARVIERAAGDARVAAARSAIAALEGLGPDATADYTPTSGASTHWGVPDDLRVGLLAHRADVIAARDRALAAAKDAEAAAADRLPNVTITALAALDSLVPSKLFDAASRQTSLGAALDLPLFDGGRRRATVDARTAAFEVARSDYDRTVLGAVHEVADAIARLKESDAARSASAQALAAEEAADARVASRARNGLADRLEVLTAADRLRGVERRERMLAARERMLRVDLYEALGGGVIAMGEKTDER